MHACVCVCVPQWRSQDWKVGRAQVANYLFMRAWSINIACQTMDSIAYAEPLFIRHLREQTYFNSS